MDLLIILCQVLLAGYVLLRLRRVLVRKLGAAKASRPPQFYDTAGRAGRYRTSADLVPRHRPATGRRSSGYDCMRSDPGSYAHDAPYSGSGFGSSAPSTSYSSSSCGGDYGGGGDAGGGGCD